MTNVYEKIRKLEIQQNIMKTALEHIAGIREHSAAHLKPHEIAVLTLERIKAHDEHSTNLRLPP